MSRAYVDDVDVVGRAIESKHHVSIDDNLRFLAKVSLGAGYFLARQNIIKWINCDELRALIAFNRADEGTHAVLKQSKIIVAHRFDPTLKESADGQMYQAACRRTPGGSLVMMQRHNGYVSFHIGILGEYMGSIYCPASKGAWPTSIEDQGEIINLFGGQMTRHSLYEWLRDWYTTITSQKPIITEDQE